MGYLLHKNPSRPHEFLLNYGKAYVLYLEVSDKSTTAALLLDIYPIDLARGKVGSIDYVNLTLVGTVRLRDLLNHLYVLIPVFDTYKYYYIIRRNRKIVISRRRMVE